MWFWSVCLNMQIDNALLKYLQTMGSLYEIAKYAENQALSYCR